MKKYSILNTSLIFIFLLFIGFVITPVKSVLAEQETAYTTISSLTEITDLNGKYALKNDIVISNSHSSINGVFKGELNGCGYKIAGNLSGPIFKEIGDGAKIFNLLIEPINNQENFIPLTLEISESVDTAELNVGILAGVISGAEISQVKISNANIISKVETILEQGGEVEYQHSLKNNTNLGILAGKSLYGTTVKNCVINGCTINLKIGNTVSQSFNFGGLFGFMANSSVANCIIDLHTSSPFTILSDTDKTINLGGISAVCDDSKNSVINNVVLLEENGIFVSQLCEVVNRGALFGVLNFELEATRLDGLLTTFSGGFIGSRIANTVNYSRLNVINYSDFTVDVFTTLDYWNDKDSVWDYGKTWINKVGEKYPSLQCFQTYSVVFDAEECLKTLNLEVMPTIENNDYNSVVIGKLSIGSEPTEDSGISLGAVEYGSRLYIEASVSTNKNYSKFFHVAGLQLNGKTIYDNETGSKTDAMSISLVQSEESTGSYMYIIDNFNAKCEGVYNVVLSKNTYKLNIHVYDLVNEQSGSIIPGKFTTNSETNPLSQKVIEMHYGDKFSLRTHVTNTDYSDKASWFIYNNKKEDVFGEKVEFAPVEENANFYTNKVEFTFNENSELFAVEEGGDKTYFDVLEYSETQDSQSNYELIIVYNKRVKQVKIAFRFEDGTEIKNKIAQILINDKHDRLTWNEEEGVYYANVAFDKGNITEYIISFESMDTNYQFLNWTFDLGKLITPEDNEEAGIFEISEDTEEPLTIFLELKQSTKSIGDNLIWLWVLLGVVGIGLIVLVIVIIKKRSGGGSSYKKYYY